MLKYPDNYRLKGNILVVDDTPANLNLLTNLLTEQGYKVRPVISGSMALTTVKAAPPDLVLLDINMPEMNGYQVCQHLKANPQTRDIPIIFISALDEVLDKVKAFTVGGVDYITKPFQFKEVLIRINIHLTLYNLQKKLEKQVQVRTAELTTLNLAYERFVPREFLSFLQKKSITEVNLGDQVQQEMTIFYSDIRGFTTMSESMTPQETFIFLNTYLSQVSPIIRRYGGFIDKYIGDAIMALFPQQIDDALQAAIAIEKEVAHFNQRRQQEGQVPITIGIGLHTSNLMLGIIGEEERMQGSVIADAITLAEHLESLTKYYGVSLIVSKDTLAKATDVKRYNFRFLDKVKIQGKDTTLSIFEIFDGNPKSIREIKLKTKPMFEDGLFLYHDQKFAEASVKFDAVLKENPDDKAARLYLHRSAHYMVQNFPIKTKIS